MPDSFNFNIGFIHSPRIPSMTLFLFPQTINKLTVFLDPPINSGVTNSNPTLTKYFRNISVTQVISKIVANGYQNNILFKLLTFEVGHDGFSSILIYLHFTLKFF